MKKLILLSNIFFLITFILNLNAEISSSGVPALMIDYVGAKSVILSGVYNGIGGDLESIYINPAGLNSIKKRELKFNYLNYPLGINFGAISYGENLPDNFGNGFLAASILFFYLPDFNMYDINGNITEKELSASDLVLILSYANKPLKIFKMNENFYLGFNIKYFQSKLVDNKVNNVCFDIGILYKIPFFSIGRKKNSDNLGIGISYQNIGKSIIYKKLDTALPKNLRVGVGYNWYNNIKHKITSSLEINFPSDSDFIINIGTEYTFKGFLSGRIGYRFSNDTVNSILFGIGIKNNFDNNIIGFDYTFISSEDIGYKHSFSLTIKFNKKYVKNYELDNSIEVNEQKNDILVTIDINSSEVYKNNKLTKKGYKLLNKIIDKINNENYKRVVVLINTKEINNNREYDEPEKIAFNIYNYLIKNGVKQDRVGYKIYKKEGTDKVKVNGLNILIIKWKKGEKERFKYHYFLGMDAYIKELYNIAIKEWEKALALDPDNNTLKEKIKEVKLKLKNKK